MACISSTFLNTQEKEPLPNKGLEGRVQKGVITTPSPPKQSLSIKANCIFKVESETKKTDLPLGAKRYSDTLLPSLKLFPSTPPSSWTKSPSPTLFPSKPPRPRLTRPIGDPESKGLPSDNSDGPEGMAVTSSTSNDIFCSISINRELADNESTQPKLDSKPLGSSDTLYNILKLTGEATSFGKILSPISNSGD
ncbi:hypothetical protein CIPAW_02G049000 [Carya illinoinensis]|uniref:Uncharacterized protein n=1 Tax=Carya illinoinensis TaxID=32201 RepID=A0A8T1RA94_CARIL|nr:hypothetical protein CIPAW_02G049000 [Carya illinoinensis]